MDTARTPSTADRAAGIALIVLPIVGALFKLGTPGWMVIVFVVALVVMVPVYVIAVVIAATGFLGENPVSVLDPKGGIRARIAAWVHSLAFVLAILFLADGGDMGSWDSVFSSSSTGLPGAVLSASELLPPLLLALSALAFVWLVVEWGRANAGRSRRRNPGSSASPSRSNV